MGRLSVRVLLVEDSPDDRFWLSRLLRENTVGIDLVESGTAESALTLAQSSQFDLIVTDYNLPGQTGVEFLEGLRATNNWTPVMVVTGSADISAAQGSVDAGAAAFLAKESLDSDALQRGIERSLEPLFVVVDPSLLTLSASDTARWLCERLSRPLDALDSDMRAIRERPSSQVGIDEQRALDALESKIVAIQDRMRRALKDYQGEAELV
ncbi:response regulator [Litorivicinus lipolyticus]|uniref:Response regulator n=1 Tax=Litorivicinus lipolyticus TaxID=418701 RepID=A0A5Q2Q5T9_9GAMM|nr:response regulator [Litorivicinus lipolyticus]